MSQQLRGADHHSGLAEVEVLPSAITNIEDNQLFFRGYAVPELAEKCSFEEVVHLLWNGRLPGRQDLETFRTALSSQSTLPPEVLAILQQTPKEAHPMALLRTLVSALGLTDESADDLEPAALQQKAVSILAKLPVMVAGIDRFRRGRSPLAPKPGLSFAANFIAMLQGQAVDELQSRALNTTLVLYADHELNASTFAARVATGTLTDMYSGITVAISTLKGILHGGANELAMNMFLDVAQPDAAFDYVAEQLAAKRRIMGFGHRVYKNGDPRSPILKKLAGELCEQKGHQTLFATAEAIEKAVEDAKGLKPNVDYYSALVFYCLGFASDMFTSVFAVSRCAGWIAHIMEQMRNNRLIRPRAEYTGEKNLSFKSLEER